MNQEVLQLVPGGKPLAQSLGFTAATVIVDNLTSSYVTLGDVGKTIPPWTYGAVVALPPGLRRATASLTPTTPAIPGPPVPVSQVTLTWTDQVLSASPGHLLQQVTTQQQNVLGTVPANAGTSTTKDLPVPAGTLAIGFSTYGGAGLSTAAAVNITGDQTGINYFVAASASASDGVQSVPFDVTDTSVTVILNQTSSVANAKIDVLAWPALPAVIVKQNQGGLPIGVFLERSDGVAIDVDQPSGVELELGVSLFRATPNSYQVVNVNGSIGSGGIASGATLTVIAAGGASVRTRLRKPEFELVAAANSIVQVECPAGTARAVVNGAVAQRVNLDFDYLDCGLAAGVALHNTGAASTAAVNGHITANQT